MRAKCLERLFLLESMFTDSIPETLNGLCAVLYVNTVLQNLFPQLS